ncbi:MAG: GGDEF domain-containing protein [Desulfobacterales bacterium]|nr:GGDEF domain-containing protein [Desulfobacterales bacterium]
MDKFMDLEKLSVIVFVFFILIFVFSIAFHKRRILDLKIRKASENELASLEQKIEMIEEDRNQLFNISVDMLCVAGFDGFFKEINPAWTNTLGWSLEELKSRQWIEFVHADDKEFTIQAMSQLTSDKPLISFENRYICKNGSYRWLSWNSFPVIKRSIAYAVARDITERKHMENEIEKLSTTDPLTGIYNRKHFFKKGRSEFIRCKRYAKFLSFLMIDVDYLKQINDLHGHNIGDMVLASLAKECISKLRENDIFGRIGGEEFAAILVETTEEQAIVIAERLCQFLSEMRINLDNGSKNIRITVSIGLTGLKEDDLSLEDMLNRADKALFIAKSSGRNCFYKL